MEAVAAVTEKFKDFAKTTKTFAYDVVHWRESSNRRKPIEILKRLQREAFSDIMKLRDRQEKVERMLTFYKTSTGSPFQEAGTRVRGEVDVLGGLVVMDNGDEQHREMIKKAGIKNEINSRLIFETSVREKDTLVAEFVASESGDSDRIGSPLSLAKVLYAANVSDWFSAVAIPMGARCRDVGVGTSYPHQEKGLTEYSGFGPPLLNQRNGSAFGIMVRKLNMVASLAQFVSGLGYEPNSAGTTRWFSTFGQVVYQITNNTKLSLLGVHKVPKLSTQSVNGAMVIPVGISRQHEYTEEDNSQSSRIGIYTSESAVAGSLALMVESELDESTRIGGWVEMKKSNPRNLQWALTMSDTPEDEFGWGLSFGGLAEGPRYLDHFQAEAFMNFNFGKKFRLQPALLYVTDGATQFPALMFRSSWSL